MERASRDTEIFSSEVRIQSSMPLQPFRGKVKFELVVVGRLWMLNTERHRKKEQFIEGHLRQKVVPKSVQIRKKLV